MAFSCHRWIRIEKPDSNGFLGLTACALTRASCGPIFFTEQGFREYRPDREGAKRFVPHDCPIVCFESQPKENEEDEGITQAVVFHKDDSSIRGAFPPNTLFRVQKVYKAGEWQVLGCKAGEGLETQRMVKPQQKLIVVTATFLPPLNDRMCVCLPPPAILSCICSSADSSHVTRPLHDGHGCCYRRDLRANSKMGVTAPMLIYGKRESFVLGLDDILAKPVLTLEQEFDRDMVRFGASCWSVSIR